MKLIKILHYLLPFLLIFSGCNVENSLIRNYKKHQTDFNNLREFVKGKNLLTVRLNDDSTVYICIYQTNLKGYKKLIDEGGISIDNPKVIESLRKIGWEELQYYELIKLIKKTGCRSIQLSEDCFTLGFRNHIVASYEYIVFYNRANKEEMKSMLWLEHEIYYIDDGIGWTKITR